MQNEIILYVPYSKTIGRDKLAQSSFSQYLHWLQKNQTKIKKWLILDEY